MVAARFVLASRSETRLRVLRQAGFDPEVVPADVDETTDETPPSKAVSVLAARKATAVAGRCPDALVLGCDSLVELDGRVLGKPSTPDEAVAWWRDMRGHLVIVWTGHCLIDTSTGSRAHRYSQCSVCIGAPSDDEIERYIATGEPLGAAGAFRLDGRASAFIDSVIGDPGTVLGVSIPTLRWLLDELGVEVTDLWA